MVDFTFQGLTTAALTLAGLSVNAKKIDIVQILDQDTLQQIFSEARPIRASVREYSRGLRYPIETGAILTDSVIIMPLEIHMEMFIPNTAYGTVYPALRAARINGKLLTVQTRTGTYRNMFIEEMPHEETTDIMNAVTMQLKLVEALQVGPNGSTFSIEDNYSTNTPQYQDTNLQGLIQSLSLPGSVLSYFNGAKVLGLF